MKLLVSDFMGDGEGGGQADVLIDTAASVSPTHPTQRGQT